MKPFAPPPAIADRPDQKILARFDLLNTFSLAVTSLIAIVILTGWQKAEFSLTLPNGWWLMQASSALVILVLTLGLLFPYRRWSQLLLARRASGLTAIVIATLDQFQSGVHHPYRFSSLLVSDDLLPFTQSMSTLAASCFILLGSALLIEPSRQELTGQLIDGLIMLLVILNLGFTSGYLFDAGLLLELPKYLRISPHALTCITLMTLVLAFQRAPFGFLSVLVGNGLGSRLARTLLPLAISVSFLIILAGERLLASDALTLADTAAVTAAFMTVLMVTVVILLARKINFLERGLLDMSRTDELTGLNNLRGFYRHGALVLQDAKLHGHPAMLLFFDVDGLKLVNDTQGHDVGSQLLQEFAKLLKETFRGSDVIGRVGGDEFAVLTSGRHHDTTTALQRLQEATAVTNRLLNRPYLLSFSVGKESVDPLYSLTLQELIANADAAMYRHKRQKRTRYDAYPYAPSRPVERP